jgi:glycosyltransferase involved in cell wall biosynthesis
MARHRQFGFFNQARQRFIHNAAIPADANVKKQLHYPPRFGFMSRLVKSKGVELLLEVFSGMYANGATLNIAGTGEPDYVRNLRERFASPQVNFLGYVPLEEFFCSVDVLVVPSLWHDPNPLVVMDALCRGIPVIGAQRGGIPEIIEEGKTGFLFDPSRPAELEEKMQIFLKQPGMVTKMEQQCRRRADEFTPENFCRQYLEVYRSLI